MATFHNKSHNTKQRFLNSVMMRFAYTYFVIMVTVLLCLLPIFCALIRNEEEKVMQRISAQAESAIQSNRQKREELFAATRNLYNDPKLLEMYYNSTRTPNASLFYNMTQLQARMKLYYQNLGDVQQVLLYLPKFNYVLTDSYIFSSREEYYKHQQSSLYEKQDWLAFLLEDSSALLRIYPDKLSDSLRSETNLPVLNFAYQFPQIGDANIRLFVLLSLSQDSLTESLLPPDLTKVSFALVGSKTGEILSSCGWNEPSTLLPSGDTWRDEAGTSYRLLHLESDASFPVCIGIQEAFFLHQKYAAAFLLLQNIGLALLLGAAISLLFAYYRSRPIERVLSLLRTPSKQEHHNHWKLIEGGFTDMAAEISHCRQTIQELDERVRLDLLEKFYLGTLSFAQLQKALSSCFGDLPNPFVIVIWGGEEGQAELLPDKLPALLNILESQNLFLYLHHNRLYSLFPAEPFSTEQIHAVIELLRDRYNIHVKAGISDVGTSLSEANTQIQQAVQRLKVCLSYPNLTFLNHTPSAALQSFIQIQDLDTLHHALLQGDEKNSRRILESIFERADSASIDLFDLQQLFFSLRVVYANALQQLLHCNSVSTSNLDSGRESNNENNEMFRVLISDPEQYELETIKNTFLSINQKLLVLSRQNEALSSQGKAVDLLHYIEQNFSDPNMCASSLASHFHISEKYVFQLVKNACGETLNNYIISLRLSCAMTLLQQSSLSVMDIAQRSGFSSSNTMYKVFMRVKGLPPSSYRT
ncbi:MAG: helix-turn-helix transcriptional regulator [bacterium]|nr:helix-turn-helix transcriptional regulator [bacterium]